MTNNSSENIRDKFREISKIGSSMESLNAGICFQFSVKVIESFVLSS